LPVFGSGHARGMESPPSKTNRHYPEFVDGIRAQLFREDEIRGGRRIFAVSGTSVCEQKNSGNEAVLRYEHCH
jgi:hypothetical protein